MNLENLYSHSLPRCSEKRENSSYRSRGDDVPEDTAGWLTEPHSDSTEQKSSVILNALRQMGRVS